ncbi:hypothetical protein NUM3379_23390 [Kineococcus sp. NUM-3379]
MTAHKAPEPWSGGAPGEGSGGGGDDGLVDPAVGRSDVLPVPGVPEPLSRYLLPTERLVVAVRRHPAQLIEPVASVVAGFALLLVADSVLPAALPYVRDVLFVAWFVLLGRTVWRFLEWRADWFIATDRRVLLRYGVVQRKVAMMPVSKVTDMSYNQSLLGRLLHYGEFVMESAGQDQALRVVKWLPVPDRLYLSICAEIFGSGSMPPVLPVPGRKRARRVQR